MTKIKKPWLKQLLIVIVSTVFILALILTTSTGCLTKKTGAADNPTDQVATITALQEQVTEQVAAIAALQSSIASIMESSPPSSNAIVVELTASHLTIRTHGAGNYPVVVLLYGTSLKANGVKVSTSANYSITFESLAPGNTMLVEIIKPATQWEASNIIELMLLDTGTVRYASASIGVG